MNCPVCRTTTLTAHELDASLRSLKCGACGGQWVNSLEFGRSIESIRSHGSATPVECALDSTRGETHSVKICPECGHILARYKVGHSLGFSLDRRGNCGGTWFDWNEWELLQRSEVREKIHLIFSPSWQTEVRAAEQAAHLQRLFIEKIGSKDFGEIQRIRRWLSSHPHRRELRAFLDSESS